MMFRRILRFLYHSILWLAALTAVLFLVVFFYYHATALDPAKYLAPETGVVYAGNNLSLLTGKPFDTSKETASLIAPFVSFRRTVMTVFSLQPELMKKFSPVMTSSFLFADSGPGRQMLVFDLGWKSFLFSAGSFIVRTAWSSDPRIQFSGREYHVAGHDTTVYTISVSEPELKMHIALTKNLLILSTGTDCILGALRAGGTGRGLARDTVFRRAASGLDGKNGTLLQRGMPDRIRRELPARYPEKNGWTALAAGRGDRLAGRTALPGELARTNPVLYRILHSNAYVPAVFPFRSSGRRWPARVFLFDALEEIIRAASGGKTAPDATRIWRKTGNEAGIILVPGAPVIYCRLLDGKSARAMLGGNGPVSLSGRNDASGLFRHLSYLFRSVIPRYAVRIGDVLLAGSSPAALRQITNRKSGGKKQMIPAVPANILTVNPQTGSLLWIRHTDGTIRFEIRRLPRP